LNERAPFFRSETCLRVKAPLIIGTGPQSWLPRFTPTHSSRLNLVERFFREITTERMRRESRHSVGEPVKAIKSYIKNGNKPDRRFQWSKTSDVIIEKITKRKGLDS
jgi:hypothetical protein